MGERERGRGGGRGEREGGPYSEIFLSCESLICRIDNNFVIRVADFGLSEDVYSRSYFRQGQVGHGEASVKLPVKWMSVESLLDGLFTEKTDVVSNH